MSAKSRSSKKVERDAQGRDVARPFDPAILAEAQGIAARYRLEQGQQPPRPARLGYWPTTMSANMPT
ncbi:MAG: hypothetical protein GXY74_15370 [Phycisphaerae bacterium]|nr:hypothetical protein [Phycisphaerae bacterium]